MKRLASPAALLVVLLLAGCRDAASDAKKVHVSYWEKWTGAEADAMQQTIDAFNRSQDRIVVDYLSVSQIDRKTMLATAGGDPPDLAGLYAYNLYSFADCEALTPLDDFIRADKIEPASWLSRYYPVYADLCTYRGKVWGLPTTPNITALHWNKTMFRAAGLDPERPPRTLDELRDFSDRLTKRNAAGEITQLGFLPQQPTWFSWAYPLWFGGALDQDGRVTIGERPENLACYRWIADWTRHFGMDAIKNFSSSFGSFASPQDPFFSGKIAMVFQGVFMNNFIRQYSPGLDYGVAAWPAAVPGVEDFTLAEADMLAIPRGAKHGREAWEFIKYVSSNNPRAGRHEELRGMELLCFLQQKNSPLREWSPFFEQHHPHPHIAVFRGLAQSPHAVHIPKMGIWDEYSRELGTTFDKVRLLVASPENVLRFTQQRIGASAEWHQRRIDRRQQLVKQ